MSLNREKRWDDVDLWNAWTGGFKRGIIHADTTDQGKRSHERDIIEAEMSANAYLDAKEKFATSQPGDSDG